MRAAVYHGARDVRIQDVPEPIRAHGEVLLTVLRSGMCGTDATEWGKGPMAFPVGKAHPVTGHRGPMVMGHEFIGEVLEADSGSSLRPGDRVASGAGVWCGTCDRCLAGRTNVCRRYFTYGLSRDGGMAERIAVDERTLVRLPDGIDLDAAGLAQPLAVGLHAARRAGVRSGDRVLVVGAGAIGSFVLAGLRHLGGADVTVVDFAGAKLERAARIGADRVVEVGPELDERLREIFGPTGADVVIEASGASGQMASAINRVRTGGIVLQVGLPSVAQEIDVHSLVMREVTVTSTLAHVCDTDLAPSLEILATTGLGAEMVDSVHGLDALPAQLDRLATGRLDGKVLFDPALVSSS